ncbi:MAG: dihydrolipoamide acetyltransferase family protein [Gemmatimonadaceae bacterium]|nr:dihydrolipoamide acetyltransferase family protein [Gemmatimonadaceae bacterium]
MPQVGENLTTGVVLEWCKAEGESVSRGDVIATVESEKAAFEVVAEEDGVLLRQDVAAGEEARVLEPIAWIGEPGEDPDEAGSAPVPPPERETAAAPADTRPSPSAGPEPTPGSMPAPPSRESLTEPAPSTRATSATAAPPSPSAPSPTAEAAPGPLAGPRPPQSAGPVPSPASRAATGLDPVPRAGAAIPAPAGAPASPSARRLARQLLVDLSSVRGTGPGGRVVRRDVLTAALNDSGGAPHQPAPVPAVVEQGDRPAPHSRLRRAVAERMSASARHVPHFHLFADVDVTEAQVLRGELGGDPAVSLTDLLVAAAARALRRHERLNAHVGDSGLVLKAGCHVGLAVAVEEGVLVPALADADRRSLAELAEARTALVESARRGLVPPDPAPTFTVTNLGGYGITRFLPLINPPECGILAAGRSEERVVAREGAAAVREVITLVLACDHRAVDGAYAAGFLEDVRQGLEQPRDLPGGGGPADP